MSRELQFKIWRVPHHGKKILFIVPLLNSCCFPSAAAVTAEKWEGIDKSIIEKYAKEHNRMARETLIDTDRGYLLLFVFLTARGVGGLGAGHCWQMPMVERSRCAYRKEQRDLTSLIKDRKK
ncbi:MAG: hypothetical protein ACLPX5_02615 [Dissulfurispiraceae bacterium]